MRRKICCGVVCSLPVLALIGFIATRDSARVRIATVSELSSIRGAGSCIWNSTRFCPNGNGCNGEVCALGLNPGNWLCPIGGQTVTDNPTLISYTVCTNVNTGLTNCGLTTSMTCGFTDTCDGGCTAGGPIGVANPVPSVCLVNQFNLLYKDSNQATGDYCFGS